MCAPHENATAGRMRMASTNAIRVGKFAFTPLAAECPLMTHSGHPGDFPQDTNPVSLERAGDLVSDRWGSTSFSVVEGANGGDTSAPVTAMICCWHERPSAIIRSNAPPAQF